MEPSDGTKKSIQACDASGLVADGCRATNALF